MADMSLSDKQYRDLRLLVVVMPFLALATGAMAGYLYARPYLVTLDNVAKVINVVSRPLIGGR